MIPGVVEAGGGKVLATTSDDFNRANSTDITAAGKKWTETSGDWAITSNQLTTATAAASYPIATLRTNTKNATVKVDRANGDGWGVAFWVVDQNNWFAVNTEMTQSSTQNAATSGSYQEQQFIGNGCSGAGRQYNGTSTGTVNAANWAPYGGTCYTLACPAGYYSAGSPGTYTCPWGSSQTNGYCGHSGSTAGGCLDDSYICCFAPNYAQYGASSPEELCGGSCCYNGSYVGGTPAGCTVAQTAHDCCIHNNTNDPGCPGNCAGQGSPTPNYQTATIYYSNPETRTWTYSQKAIIRKAVAGTVSVVANTAAVTSTETVGAAVAASSPTRPTSLTVTLVGEGITISAPGAAGGTITGSHTATGANRGKKHGVSIAPATVVQSNAVDNFVYTKP